MSKNEEELKSRYGVDDFYYPNLSMSIDLPGGLKGEIESITETLTQNGFEANSENIFNVMRAKKKLMSYFIETEDGKKSIKQYSKILDTIKPVGFVVPLELFLSYLVVGSLIFLLDRFLGSFMEEAGKIAAKRLLDRKTTQKNITLQIKISEEEYEFLKTMVPNILENDPALLDQLKKLKKE